MQPPLAQNTNDDLMTAYREGLFSDEELLAAAGADFRALVERAPATAIRLADSLSGVRLYVPARLTDESRLKQAVNESEAQTVISLYRTDTLHIPRFVSLRSAIRRRKITALHDDGWSPPQLALHFQLTERQIYSILRRCRLEAAAGSRLEDRQSDRVEQTTPTRAINPK
jgi:hypothetical protein